MEKINGARTIAADSLHFDAVILADGDYPTHPLPLKVLEEARSVLLVLFCWQGMFYLIAMFYGEAMPEPMRVELSIVGGVLIVSSGLAILGIKDCKTVNLLPSLLVPVLFYLVKALIQ